MANVTFYAGIPNGQSGTYKLYHSDSGYASSTSGMTLLGTLSSTFQSFTVDDARYLYVAEGTNTNVISLFQIGQGYKQAAILVGSRVEANGNYVMDTGEISSISGASSNAWLSWRPDPGNPSGGGNASAIAPSYEFKLTTDNASNQKAIAYGLYGSGSSVYVGATFTATATGSVDATFPAKTTSGSGVPYKFKEIKIYNEDDAPAYASSIASDANYIGLLPNIASASMEHGTGTLDQTLPGTPGRITLTFSSGTVSTDGAGNYSRTHDYQPGYPSGSYQVLSGIQLNTANGGIAFNLKGNDVGNTADFWATTVVDVEMGTPTDWRDVFTAYYNAINARGSGGTGDFGAVSKSDPASVSGTGTITVNYASTAVLVGGNSATGKHSLSGSANTSKPVFRESSGVKPLNGKVAGVFNVEALPSYAFRLIGDTLETSGGETALATSVVQSVSTSGSYFEVGGVSGSAHASLNIPGGALGSATEITIDLTGEGDPRLNGISRDVPISKATKYSNVVSLEPHGQTFDSAVTLKFKLTGSFASSCPADLKIFKSHDEDGFWYQLPSDFWSCSSGEITINTTKFSRYQAVGGTLMSTITQIKDSQIAKITTANKIETQALDITGSVVQSTVSDSDRFILQSVGGTAASVSASVMQNYFSAVDVTASNANESVQLVFHDGTPGAKLARDTNLVYNASTNILTVPKLGAFEAAGAIDFSDEAMTNVNVDSGAIDGAVIGANSKAAGSFTTLVASGSVDLGAHADHTITATGRFDSDLVPSSDGARDLGSSTLEWKDLYIDGVAYVDSLQADQLGAALDANSQAITNINVDSGTVDNVVIGGSTAAAGTFTTLVAGGNVDLGDATSDTITATGRFDSDLVPSSDSARDLGTSALQWAEAHIDTGNIDTIVSTHFTASYAKITDLDVTNINSITQTETTLEIVDKKIVAASGSASSAADGGGLQIGGHSAGDDVASILYDHSNLALDFNIGGTTEIRLEDGKLLPQTDNDIDLGETGLEFKDLYLDGVAYIDSLQADQLGAALDANSQAITNINVDSGAIDGTVIGANSKAAGSFTALVASGSVDLGGHIDHTITALGRFDSDLIPSTDSARDLGTSALQWAEAHIDHGYIDAITATGTSTLTTVDINGGAIDGTAIGATSQSTIKATSISGSSTLDIVGASVLHSTLNVQGAATMAAVSATSLSASSTLDVLGASVLHGTLNVQGAADLDGALTVEGLGKLNGDVDLGNATSDTITATGRFDSDLVPSTDGARDLGASGLEWKDLYLDGTANIDSLVADTADINGGTVDNVVIGGSTAAAGTFTTLVAGGNVDLGDATSDTITATGRFDSDLVPSSDSARDLGTSALQWAEAHIDTGNIDTVVSTYFTASYAKITDLDVTNINSITQTETTLEIVDKKIVAASGSASSAADGGGLQIGGHSAGDDVASILYDHSNLALDFNIGGTTEIRLEDGKLLPQTDNDIDLGETGLEFKDLYLDGTAYIDSLQADQLGAALDANSQAITNINVDSGAIDGTVIGANSAAAGTFAAVVATSADINGVGDVSDTLTLSKGSGNALSVSAGGTAAFAGPISCTNASVTFSALADLTNSTVAHGDKFVIQDADASGVAKEITFNHVAAKMAGDGLLNTNGVLSIQTVEDVGAGALGSGGSIMSANGVTASLSQTPLATSGVQVYKNGVLQLNSGSVADYYDYEYQASSNKVFFRSACAATDIVQVRYIKKNA